MAVTEQQRHELYEWAKRLGDEGVAATLMELLPPVGWADVATKRDIDQLRTELRMEFRADLSGLETQLHRELRLQLYWIVGSIWAALGVGLTVLGR